MPATASTQALNHKGFFGAILAPHGNLARHGRTSLVRSNSEFTIPDSDCFLANHADLCTLISMQRKFTIGLIQMVCTPDPQENLRRAESRVDEAAEEGAEVICLPELFRSQYFCQREDATLFDLAETVPGPSTQALGKIAKEKQVVVIAPVFERRAAGVYHNSAAIIDANGEVAGIYRKMHIPDDPAYYEKFYFTPGDLGFRAFDTRSGRIAALICWDQWYPEGARLAALQGASVLFYPTAIGWHPHEKAQYGDCPTRCLANHPARPRHRQWGVRGGGESRRI